MMDFIQNNYLLVMIIGIFILFAILGFLVDRNRINKEINQAKDLGVNDMSLPAIEEVTQSDESEADQNFKEALAADNSPVNKEEPVLNVGNNNKGKEVKDNN